MADSVTIISVRPMPLATSPGAIQEFLQIVYTYKGGFPRTVFIDPAHDSQDERVRVISEDLAQAKAAAPEVLQLP